MHTFFHGWRRKAGIATLVMACAFQVIWLRSLAIQDYVAFGQYYSMFTTCNGIGFQQIEFRDGVSFPNNFRWEKNYTTRSRLLAPNEWRGVKGQNMKPEDDLPPIAGWHCQVLGFAYAKSTWRRSPSPVFGDEPFVYGYVTYLICPHWLCCLSLTLLSAYLLLWKPRKRPSPN